MAWDAITDAEIQPDQPVVGESGFGRKVKDNLDYLYGNIASGSGLPANGSFEIDADSDGIPDQWTRSLYPGGSGSFETTNPAHGAKAYKFVHPGGAGNGGGYLESDYIEVSQLKRYILGFILWTSVAGMKNQVIIRCFDKAKVDLSSDQTLYNSTSNPTSATYYLRGFNPAANTSYIKIRLIGGYTDTDVAGTIYFDYITLDNFMTQYLDQKTIGEYSTNSTSWVDVASVELNIPNTYMEINFNADVHGGGSSSTGYIRFRLGSIYSNEASWDSTLYATYAFSLNGDMLSRTLTMQLKIYNVVGSNLAYGRKPDGNTRIGILA